MQFGFGKKNKGGQGIKVKNRRFRSGRKKEFSESENLSIKCICPECGFVISHQQRVQCFKLKCPQCNSTMARRFVDD
ncbi:MAG: hypothetical protein HQK76_12505 [Desulfobacterales bacterium]|nr:hypothetical protein [Desulfobacterales bacterium]